MYFEKYTKYKTKYLYYKSLFAQIGGHGPLERQLSASG